jgi:hypothetical protein
LRVCGAKNSQLPKTGPLLKKNPLEMIEDNDHFPTKPVLKLEKNPVSVLQNPKMAA